MADDPLVDTLTDDMDFCEQAAVIVVNLATGEEPITGGTEPEPERSWCALCHGESRSAYGSPMHDSSCPWRQAKELMEEVRGS